MLTGLNHLTLATADLPRALAFYHGLLGFRLAAQWDGGAYLALGELWLCLSLARHGGAQPPARRDDYTHYAFSIGAADFAMFQNRLVAAGVQQWQRNSSEGESFYFLDPDGHRLEAHVGDLASRLGQCRAQPYSGMRIFE